MDYPEQDRKPDAPSLEQFDCIPLADDGLPEIVSIREYESLITERFGSMETFRRDYDRAYALEFIRCVENYYARWRSECSPVYVFESIDGYHYVNDYFRGERLSKPAFVLDDEILLDGLDHNREMLEPRPLWMPCGFERSPVIIVYDYKDSRPVARLIEHLKRAKIDYFRQSIDQIRDLVRSFTLEDIKNDLKAQRSKDFERYEYERTFALWLI